MIDLKKIFYGVAGAVPRIGSILGLVVPSIESEAAMRAPNFVGGEATLVDGATIAVDASLAETFRLTCANNNVRAIQPPTNAVAGMRLYIVIINTSGGALTNTTFAPAIKQPALTLPATGTNRHFYLEYDGTEWSIFDQSTNNIPN